jgi:predicted transcriptional regulator
MICMGSVGSMDDEMVDASDMDVGGDARDEIGSGCDICMELNLVYI